MAVARLYPSHVPLGPASKLLLTAGTSLGAFIFPQRADLVAAFGELSGSAAFERIHARMLQHPTGELILREKPVITVRFEAMSRAQPCLQVWTAAVQASSLAGSTAGSE
jgi:ubiquinone biosynthesis protein COQ4